MQIVVKLFRLHYKHQLEKNWSLYVVCVYGSVLCMCFYVCEMDLIEQKKELYVYVKWFLSPKMYFYTVCMVLQCTQLSFWRSAFTLLRQITHKQTMSSWTVHFFLPLSYYIWFFLRADRQREKNCTLYLPFDRAATVTKQMTRFIV